MTIINIDAQQTAKLDPSTPVDVFLIGDSTVATSKGWGNYFGAYLFPSATAVNKAASGRSSKSYYNEAGKWDSVKTASVPQLSGNPGSILLIQFGHNDWGSIDPLVETMPMGPAPYYVGEFTTFMQNYITETVALGSTPILITPLSRMYWSGATHLRDHTGVSPFKDFPNAVKKLAADNGLQVIDLEQRSHDEFQAFGEAYVLANFARNGTDRTHLSPNGGTIVAGWVADEIDKLGSGKMWTYVK